MKPRGNSFLAIQGWRPQVGRGREAAIRAKVQRNGVKANEEESYIYGVKTLPDYLVPGLELVFIGINPGLFSVRRGHYFARPTSRFWRAFSASELSAGMRRSLGINVLGPEHDAMLPGFGFGFTDVVKRPSANVANLDERDFQRGVPLLVEKLQRCRPHVACFHGLMGYRPFLKWALHSSEPASLGPQPHAIGSTKLYVVPNPSPANAHFTMVDQTAWYNRLADFIAEIKEQRTKAVE